MRVVGEEAPRVAYELVSRYHLLEENERVSKVVIVSSNSRLSDATREHVVDGAAIVVARLSCHAFNVADRRERIDACLRRVCSSLRAVGVRAEHRGVRPRPLGSDPS